ncbi:hypothetical protein BS50DRAFT_162033 [Corynespora cassiicola Philippines]|uniref:Uncharacterized protein n=1 Tax=Corynespora cassiicola Philippines TaxID=1448308 RepID=A0A2T2N6E3_CORCC|nr:hypothetical protein BS50DRAFT_162033 [Corynespora cassiicola Philippines]
MLEPPSQASPQSRLLFDTGPSRSAHWTRPAHDAVRPPSLSPGAAAPPGPAAGAVEPGLHKTASPASAMPPPWPLVRGGRPRLRLMPFLQCLWGPLEPAGPSLRTCGRTRSGPLRRQPLSAKKKKYISIECWPCQCQCQCQCPRPLARPGDRHLSMRPHGPIAIAADAARGPTSCSTSCSSSSSCSCSCSSSRATAQPMRAASVQRPLIVPLQPSASV